MWKSSFSFSSEVRVTSSLIWRISFQNCLLILAKFFLSFFLLFLLADMAWITKIFIFELWWFLRIRVVYIGWALWCEDRFGTLWRQPFFGAKTVYSYVIQTFRYVLKGVKLDSERSGDNPFFGAKTVYSYVIQTFRYDVLKGVKKLSWLLKTVVMTVFELK